MENGEHPLYKWNATVEEDANLQHDNVCFSRGEKVGTKYGDIIFCFRKDSKIKNLHKFKKKK